jgi:nitrite reductase (NADH) large subunit
VTAIPLPVVAQRSVWRAAQWLGVVLTVVLLIALVAWPQGTLTVLWDMVIPLLPATFLINPLLWRNVCPLATLNEVLPDSPRRRTMDGALLRYAWTVGIVLLFAMVPARRFLFNENGPVLAAAVALVAILALAGGAVFSRRAGFCGSICPVLPVEKLYGQAPLVPMKGARCGDCVRCTSVGCIELAGSKAVPQTIGPVRRDTRWLRSSFGVFAAAFPGFIIGYFTTVNGDLSTAWQVYARILGLAAASYGIVALVTFSLSIRATVAMQLLGAASLGAYYWYAAPNLTVAYHAPTVTTWVVRGLMGLTLAWWLLAWYRRPHQAPAV